MPGRGEFHPQRVIELPRRINPRRSPGVAFNPRTEARGRRRRTWQHLQLAHRKINLDIPIDDRDCNRPGVHDSQDGPSMKGAAVSPVLASIDEEYTSTRQPPRRGPGSRHPPAKSRCRPDKVPSTSSSTSSLQAATKLARSIAGRQTSRSRFRRVVPVMHGICPPIGTTQLARSSSLLLPAAVGVMRPVAPLNLVHAGNRLAGNE